MTPRYFFDAYALLRVALDEPTYSRFRGEVIVTERGHVYEFVRSALKTHRAKEVLPALAALAATEVDPTPGDLLVAAKLHRSNPRLSAQDALGYALARREQLRFLTGDRAFRRMPGVEYVE